MTADFDTNSKKGLGRGLDALIPGGSNEPQTGVNEVNIGLIDANPHQPRTVFDEEELADLATSIKKHGMLQPLVVSPKNDHYELIAGERRLRASKIAGLTKVPVIVREVEDHQKLEMAIIENVHRSDLNPIDEALSYRKLIEEFNYTQEQVSEGTGKSRTAVANKIRLLALPTEMKRAIKEGKISEGHGRALLSVTDSKKREALFQTILSEGLNVREVESAAKNNGQPIRTNLKSGDDLALKQLADDLKTYLGTSVAIKNSKSGGRIEINYFSSEELNRIYQKIKGVE